MKWPYAELTETAKKFGGPEALIKTIKDTSRMAGHRDMYPVIGVVAVVATAAGVAIDRLVTTVNSKRKLEKRVSGEAEQALLANMKAAGGKGTEPQQQAETY